MSDYLWDKTGEPEADVEQLENLLGTLKYRQRPLEIPAAAMPSSATATRTATFFSRSRLAIAASLVLMLLAGTWFITWQDEAQKNQRADIRHGSATAENAEPESAFVTNVETGKVPVNNASVNNAPVNNVGGSRPREDKTGIVAASLRRTQRAPRRLDAKRQKLQPRREDGTDASRELIAANGAMRWQVEQPLTAEQRAATEQLMLALSVASAKFNYAQREMQEIGRAGK